MTKQPELSIFHEPKDWLPLTIPGSEGVSIMVYKADPLKNVVVLKAKFEPGARMPRHSHHCMAVAYTISGDWAYDEGDFVAGSLAYELVGNDHVPYSVGGTEMMITFISENGQYLDNELPDGSAFHLGMKFFQAVERISLEDYEKLDVLSLVELLPAKRPGGQIAA